MRTSCLTLLLTALLIVYSGALFSQPLPTPAAGLARGVVSDVSSGHPISHAFISFYSVGHSLSSAFALSDSSGAYAVRLDTGSYLAVALAFHFYPEWYNGVSTRDSATVLTVGVKDTVDVNFGLRPIPPPVFVNVKGTVTDSVTGMPLRGALVVYYRPFHWPPIVAAGTAQMSWTPEMTMSVPGIGFINAFLWIGITDSLGNYTAHVPAGVTLIAGAFKFGYIPEFYDDKRTPFEANKLVFAHDSSGIDFDLLPVPAATNSISGRVVDSAGSGVPSHLILIQRILTPQPSRVYYATTDSAGNYTFAHLPEGDYLLQALPFKHELPAWYDADSCGVADWHASDPIHASGNLTGIDVCVKALPPPGVGLISGSVVGSAQSGMPVAQAGVGGVVVYAVSTSSGQVAGFDVTDIDGSFAIANLPEGSFRVVADKEGFAASSQPEYALSPSNNYQVSQSSISLVPDSPLGVGDGGINTPREFSLEQNYPNPFNPTTKIAFEVGQSTHVTLKVYDLLGREVATLVNEVRAPGRYQAEWNAASFASGVYEYRLSAGSYLDVKKMLLVR